MHIPILSLRGLSVLNLVLLSGLLLWAPAQAWERYLPERALYSLYEAAEAHREAQRHDEAHEIFEELVARSREWDFPSYTHHGLWYLATFARQAGGLEEALRLYEESLVYFREAQRRGDVDYPPAEWMLLENIRSVHDESGRLNAALRIHRENVEQIRELVAAQSGADRAASLETHLANLADPELRELVEMMILTEHKYRIRQGNIEGALGGLARLTETLERYAARSHIQDTVLAKAYSHQVTLMATMADPSSLHETIEKQRALPQTESIAYYTESERVRYALLKFFDTGENLDEALEEARAGIQWLEQKNFSRGAAGARVNRLIMLAEAGRGEEALRLLHDLLEETQQLGEPAVDWITGYTPWILSRALNEPGHDERFWNALQSIWRSAEFLSAAFAYENYARYHFKTGAVDDAIRYARLGLAYSEMFERIATTRNLEAAIDTWLESLDSTGEEGAIREVPVVVPQESRDHAITVPDFAFRTPFDFVEIEYMIPLSSEEAGANFRARTSVPARVKFFDPRNKRLIGVDSNGNGDFNGLGEVAFRDARLDGFPELPLEAEEREPVLKLFVYPITNPGPNEPTVNPELTITVEIESNGEWRTWAITRLVSGDEAL